MRDRLLAWQWQLYPDNHASRANLVIHLVTWPFFAGGVVLVPLAFVLGHAWLAAFGPLAMALAMAAQGRGHRREAVPPVPFDGPGDAFARIFVDDAASRRGGGRPEAAHSIEQLWTWPRFVLSGGVARAWRRP